MFSIPGVSSPGGGFGLSSGGSSSDDSSSNSITAGVINGSGFPRGGGRRRVPRELGYWLAAGVGLAALWVVVSSRAAKG